MNNLRLLPYGVVWSDCMGIFVKTETCGLLLKKYNFTCLDLKCII